MRFITARLLLTMTACITLGHAATLTDNLGKTTSSTEFVGGSTWIAGAFATDNASYRITSATLLLATPEPSTAKLDLYSTGSGQPGSLLSTLTSPASFPAIATPVNFMGSSYVLSPNTSYWLVLKAPTGSFDWSWTGDNTGTGAGFLSRWAASDDSGATWFVAETEPMQFRVLADAVVNPAIPEPQSFALAAAGLLGVFGLLRNKRLNEPRA